jgi:hypothetical protein
MSSMSSLTSNMQGNHEGRTFTLEDAKAATKVKEVQSPIDATEIPGLGSQRFKEVTTELVPASFSTPEEEWVDFHNYYREDCWIIAEVFNNKRATDFNLRQIISMQLEKAGIVKRNPRVVILKNVVHDPIKDLLLSLGDLDLDKTLKLMDTPLVKGVDRVVLGRILEAEKTPANHIILRYSELGGTGTGEGAVVHHMPPRH